MYLKIKDDRKYLFVMLDSETRFWLSQMVAEHKGNDDVSPMFKEAKKRAKKVPLALISDGAANFHHAWKEQYRAKNFLHKDTEHHRHIHLSGDMNNNQMESFNSNTLSARRRSLGASREMILSYSVKCRSITTSSDRTRAWTATPRQTGPES